MGLSNRNDRMIQFRINGTMNNRLPNVGRHMPGEICLLRISQIMCLFPNHKQIRTVEQGWTLDVYEEDWEKVERAFRNEYLGREVKAI